MKVELYYFCSQVIDNRNYKRFGISYFLDKGYSVFAVNLMPWLYPNAYEQQRHKKCNISEFSEILIGNDDDFNNLFEKLKSNAKCISLLGDINEKTYFVYDKLSKHGVEYCIWAQNIFPERMKNGCDEGLFKKLITSLHRSLSIRSIFKKIIFKINVNLKNYNYSAACVIVSGSAAREKFRKFINENTIVIDGYSDDYENYLDLENDSNNDNDEPIVFLDENLIQHSDYFYDDVVVENETKYYSEMKNLFENLIRYTNKNIVIAAHPRADIVYCANKYEGFDVVINKTAELVKKAGLIVVHASTSINLAILNKKPIIFITTNRQIRSRPSVRILASWFDVEPLNISMPYSEKDIHDHTVIYNESYEQYKTLYITENESIINRVALLDNNWISKSV